MIEFDECGNYRGCLQIKEDELKCYWRVDCDVDEIVEWHEIPRSLYDELVRFHGQRRDMT